MWAAVQLWYQYHSPVELWSSYRFFHLAVVWRLVSSQNLQAKPPCKPHLSLSLSLFTFCFVVTVREIYPCSFSLAGYHSDCANRPASARVSVPNIQLLLLQEIQPSITVPEVIFPTCQPTSSPNSNRQRPSCLLQKKSSLTHVNSDRRSSKHVK